MNRLKGLFVAGGVAGASIAMGVGAGTVGAAASSCWAIAGPYPKATQASCHVYDGGSDWHRARTVCHSEINGVNRTLYGETKHLPDSVSTTAACSASETATVHAVDHSS